MSYNWELPDWPNFTFSVANVEVKLYEFAQETGAFNALINTLPEEIKSQITLELILFEAINTSAIEGEFLSREDVMSSIKNNLGINKTIEVVKDKRASGIADLMIEVRKTFNQDLDEQTLHHWHKLLFGESRYINVAEWRKGDEAMQIVSGGMGREKIHFEAPPSTVIQREMDHFFKWLINTRPNQQAEIKDPVIRAGIAHLYFESIHPYEDGNGRIGRAIAEQVLSQTLGRPVMLSLSNTIERNKDAYYQALKIAQKSNEISGWLEYFVDIALNAQLQAKQMIDFTLKKVKLFDIVKEKINERQVKVLQKMFGAGLAGFQGDMTAKKYISITRASKATATRDLQELEKLGVLTSYGGGRSVHYKISDAFDI